jgi:hypothetical protein
MGDFRRVGSRVTSALRHDLATAENLLPRPLACLSTFSFWDGSCEMPLSDHAIVPYDFYSG